MKLHDLKPDKGSKSRKTRVGRGKAAGGGTYAGRGIKGQKARGRMKKKAYFEGGQLPLVRRLPMKRGFTNLFRTEYQEINLDDINKRFDDGATVTPEALVEVGLLRDADEPVVILGRGDVDKALTVKAHRISKLPSFLFWYMQPVLIITQQFITMLKLSIAGIRCMFI